MMVSDVGSTMGIHSGLSKIAELSSRSSATLKNNKSQPTLTTSLFTARNVRGIVKDHVHKTDISIKSQHELRIDGFGNTLPPLAGTYTVQNIHFNKDRITVEFYSTEAFQETLIWKAQQTQLISDLSEQEFALLGEAIKMIRERAQDQCKACGHLGQEHDFAGCNGECTCKTPFGGTSTGPQRN